MTSNGFVDSLFNDKLGAEQTSVFGVSTSNVVILVNRAGLGDSIIDDAGWIVGVGWIDDMRWIDGASEGSVSEHYVRSITRDHRIGTSLFRNTQALFALVVSSTGRLFPDFTPNRSPAVPLRPRLQD